MPVYLMDMKEAVSMSLFFLLNRRILPISDNLPGNRFQ